MELKKNEKYNLENKSPLFFSIGLVVAILCVVLAFEWKAEYEPMEIKQGKDEFPPTYLPPVTAFKTPEPPKPVEVKSPRPNLQPPVFVDVPVEVATPFTKSPDDIPFDAMAIDEPLPPVPTPPETFERVESMPNFPGGTSEFYKYISKNIEYPRRAKNLNITGKVFVRFVINIDGKITEVEVMKGIGGGCDEEAIRVVENAPNWNPGKQRGRAVRVRMVVPIQFSLSN